MSQIAADTNIEECGSDAEYDDYLAKVADRFAQSIKRGTPLFTTDTPNLFENVYIPTIPQQRQQHHTCHACRHFINQYAGLVTINARGELISALWDVESVPPDLVASVARLETKAETAKVTGVFFTDETTLGKPETGPWHHLHADASGYKFKGSRTSTAFQQAAEKTQDYQQVSRALATYQKEHLQKAVSLLQAGSLYGSEKVLKQAEWLLDLQERSRAAKNSRFRENIVWAAVAVAPAGFCHPSSSMLGTLLADIANGKDFTNVAKSFAAKMKPTQYQRPQAAPDEGTIKQAEKLVAQLGIAASLHRRYANLEEVRALWRPATETVNNSDGGVFAHLRKPQPVVPLQTAKSAITWASFRRTVLPRASKIEAYLNAATRNFIVLTTAVDADAPPILQWDCEERRNPVSWFVWTSGSPPSQYGLTTGWHNVPVVSLLPPQWGETEDAYSHHGAGVIFFIDKAKESQNRDSALYPSQMRSELHGCRSVIEAHSNSQKMQDNGGSHAIGLDLRQKNPLSPTTVRVTSDGVIEHYLIDRFE